MMKVFLVTISPLGISPGCAEAMVISAVNQGQARRLASEKEGDPRRWLSLSTKCKVIGENTRKVPIIHMISYTSE